MTKHKWHKEIKAWADGAEIEKRMLNDTWQRVGHPDWYEFENYRIKPQPKEWVGLSDDEMDKIFCEVSDNCINYFPSELNVAWFKALEEKNKEQDNAESL